MFKNFKNGLIKENPVFTLYLGMCSALAISTNINNALGMGVSVIMILTLTNVTISAIRKITPDEIRIPVYIVVIASAVSIVEMLVHAFAPSLYSSLGVFISLIVVNCIILGRAEAFASKNGMIKSALDGFSMGVGYTLSLLLISLTREFLATMSLTLTNPFANDAVVFKFAPSFLEPYKISLFQTATGSFFTFAIYSIIFGILKEEKKKTRKVVKRNA